ncbi:MAG TPA: chromate transporter [Clostridiales bacterium]|jgi:chromate transporter|nr:chromate transporter [Clostridiales bacterium]
MIALLKLFLIFFRIGLFSFGGGYAMLPLIYQSIQEFNLMDEEEFSNLVALSQVTPGPIAINAATYVGFQYAGIAGATVATIGVVAPSFILALLVLHFFVRFQESRGLQSVLGGIRPATIGLIGSAAVFLGQQGFWLDQQISWPAIALAGIATLMYGRFKINPILLTLAAGAAGAFLIR